MSMIGILHALALATYVLAGALIASSLAAGSREVSRPALLAIVAAVLAHGAALAAYTAGYGELPLVGLAASISTLAFLIGVGLLISALLRQARPLAVVLIPLIGMLVLAALVLGVRPSGDEFEFRGAWFSLHVVTAFVAYAGLAIAFSAGLLYLLQFRALKEKNFGRAFRFLPPLETLDAVGQRALVLGLGALSFALLLGWAWTVRFRASLTLRNPEVIWGVVTWLVFVSALVARRGGAGGDRRGASAAVAGFMVVVLAYVVLRVMTASGGLFL